MLAQEYIQVIDHQQYLLTLGELPVVASDEVRGGGTVETTIADRWTQFFQEGFSQYRFAFPDTPKDISHDGKDQGFLVINPSDVNYSYPTGDIHGRRVILTALFFTNTQRRLHFPYQGMEIEGRPGRMVIWPGYWTHPYRLMGHGEVIISYQLYPEVESIIGKDTSA